MREGHGELYYYFTCAYSRSFNICVYITSGLVFARARVKLNLVLFQGHMKFALAWRPWMLSMGMEMVVAVIVVVIEVVVIVVVVVVVVVIVVVVVHSHLIFNIKWLNSIYTDFSCRLSSYKI